MYFVSYAISKKQIWYNISNQKILDYMNKSNLSRNMSGYILLAINNGNNDAVITRLHL